MEINTTELFVSMENYYLFNKYIRSINFILSCTGVSFNLCLIIILISIGRRQCATYFLLILMTICDFLYCTVYLSIALTVDQYINIINHQILCPLSFFLIPFTFTGSTILLFICLLHFITNYERKYDTVLGQISGRLSVVFVLAFIIIRSVLSSTSVELMIPDPNLPEIKYCTIDMNTPPIVATVQKINHIFAEVTDILVYMGWIILLIISLISLICRKKSKFYNQRHSNSSTMVKPLSLASLLFNNNNNINHEPTMNIELSDMLNLANEINETMITNRQRHHNVSLIILSISLISIIFYLPIMINKYLTMFIVYRDQTLLTTHLTYFLQILQHTSHLFCLSIRFLPYFIFDERLHLFLKQMIGIKCMKIERRKTLSRRRMKHKYIWHCECHRREKISEFNDNNGDA